MLDAHLIAKTRPLANQKNMVYYLSYRITVLSSRLFRVEESEDGSFQDEATQVVWFRDMKPVSFTVKENENEIRIETKEATLVLKDSMDTSYVILSGKHIQINNQGNLLGTYRTLDGCRGNIYYGRNQIVTPIELGKGVCSTSGVAVLDDHHSLLLKDDGSIAERPAETRDDYIFAFGHDFRGAVKALYEICGPTPLIPRFALGNWWSRYHAYSHDEYMNLLDRLEEEEVPVTVATIDMDWHWSKNVIEKMRFRELNREKEEYGYYTYDTGWTGYSWNTDLFPDYKKTLKEIHKRNLKVMLNLHPAGGVRWFEDMYPQMAQAMGVDASDCKVIPFDFTSDRYINAYFKVLHKPYEKDGVDFWWIDWQQGMKSGLAGLDPLWALNHYHTLDSGVNKTSMILSRYAGVGSHRYPLGFSGDTQVTWESLNYIPYFTATASNVGYSWWSHDIGGHMGGYKDNELYVRYVQFGIFSPINRLHCCDAETCTKEPEVYFNGTGKVAVNYLQLRHRMIPFLFSVDVETAETGKTLIEPMYYAYPEEKEAYKCQNQYIFGGQLLVRPVTHRGDREMMAVEKVWLPKGQWTDIFTGDTYCGGRWVEMVRWLDSIPVLAKEGAFFVLDGRKHTNAYDNPTHLQIQVYNGNGSFVLAEEKTEGHVKKSFFVSEKKDNHQVVTFTMADTIKGGTPREIRLEFRNVHDGHALVKADGKKISFSCKTDAFLNVILTNVKPGVEYMVDVTVKENKTEERNAQFLYSLIRFQNFNDTNMKFYRAIAKASNEQIYQMIEETRDFSKNQKKRLYETWENFR